MIKYSLDVKPKCLELSVHGHSGQPTVKVSNGTDFAVVCGMVSAVSQMCVCGLREYGTQCKILEYKEGALRVKVRNNAVSLALMMSCIRTLNAIKQRFPTEFVG